jgi:Uncharacterized protein conserved in bacteria
MADNNKLDAHAQAILEEYRQQRPVFAKMRETIPAQVRALFDEAGIVVASIESRVKEEKSLAGKLELKGAKYGSLADITDIFGMRIITFYVDDVDKVASVVERLFEVDWDNSVDKRKLHEVDRFGYMSLALYLPASRFSVPFRGADADHPAARLGQHEPRHRLQDGRGSSEGIHAEHEPARRHAGTRR